MYWENNDVGGKKDCSKLSTLLEKYFEFAVKIFQIPPKNVSACVKSKIQSVIADHNEEDFEKGCSLSIFHYAGHGVGKPNHMFHI